MKANQSDNISNSSTCHHTDKLYQIVKLLTPENVEEPTRVIDFEI
jgi:hypothetical protein